MDYFFAFIRSTNASRERDFDVLRDVVSQTDVLSRFVLYTLQLLNVFGHSRVTTPATVHVHSWLWSKV